MKYFENLTNYNDIKTIYKELTNKYKNENKIISEINKELDLLLKNVEKIQNTKIDKKELAKEALDFVCPEQFLKLAYDAYNFTPLQHYNPYTKIFFSGLNLWTLELAMLLNNFNSCKWSTFCQYNNNNIKIKKGEKATTCTLAINKYKKDEKGEKQEDGYFFKSYKLFNEVQTMEV